MCIVPTQFVCARSIDELERTTITHGSKHISRFVVLPQSVVIRALTSVVGDWTEDGPFVGTGFWPVNIARKRAIVIVFKFIDSV